MKKTRTTALLMCILMMLTLLSTLVGCSATREEIPIPIVEKNIYIYDQDDIISDEVEATLNKMLTELEEETEVEFAVISIKSLLNRSIEEYSNEVFNTLGIGKDDKDNGVLLLFSRTDGRVRIEVGLGLEGCLNDSKCGRILDNNFVPYREKDEYTTATEILYFFTLFFINIILDYEAKLDKYLNVVSFLGNRCLPFHLFCFPYQLISQYL